MSNTIKVNDISMNDGNGFYKDIDYFSDKAVEETIASVEQVGEEQKEIINTVSEDIMEQVNQIEQNASDVVAINSRIDALEIPSGGDTNVEVADARVGYDGSSYSNLKNRLDSETEDILSEITSNSQNIEQNIAETLQNEARIMNLESMVDGIESLVDRVDTVEEVKTEKVQIYYIGEKSFKVNGEGEDLTYEDIYNLLKESPNFVLMIHGNREHRCTMIDDVSNPRQMRFVVPILSDNVLKTQSIYVTSNDGITITNVTVSNINSENQSNKIQEITEQIKGSTGQYPSVKAVYDFVGEQINDIKTELEELISKLRENNIIE